MAKDIADAGDPAPTAANNPPTANRVARETETLKASTASSAKILSEEPSPQHGDYNRETAEDDDVEPGRFEDFPQDDFTGLAWRILQATRRLGEGRPRPEVASVRRLLASILLSGFSKKDLPNSGAWLLSQIDRDSAAIRKRLADQYPVILQRKGSLDSILTGQGGVAAAMTAKLHEVLDLARRLARQSHLNDPRARVSAKPDWTSTFRY